jgi:hypothetical protein
MSDPAPKNTTQNLQKKVFCIGFHKTGTSSLSAALKILGYSVTGPNGVNDPNIRDNVLSMADDLLEVFDAFQDNPWPLLYERMDKKYPGSKFILTIRDSRGWMRSQVRHFGGRKTPMREWIYGAGCPKDNEEIYIGVYERHNQMALSYFRERPNDFIVMDLARGDGWKELCAFLDKPPVDELFPHRNRAADRAIFRIFNLATQVVSRISRTFQAGG